MATNSKGTEPKILLDSDVVIHFIDGMCINELPNIFPDRLVFVDVVLEELLLFPEYKVAVSNFMTMNKIERIELQDNQDALVEYSRIIKFAGKGEAACMALAKVDKNYIASSNLSDIKEYCDKNEIKIITTMDFLLEALYSQIFSEDECDQFIKEAKAKGNKLPVNSIAEYALKYAMPKSHKS